MHVFHSNLGSGSFEEHSAVWMRKPSFHGCRSQNRLHFQNSHEVSVSLVTAIDTNVAHKNQEESLLWFDLITYMVLTVNWFPVEALASSLTICSSMSISRGLFCLAWYWLSFSMVCCEKIWTPRSYHEVVFWIQMDSILMAKICSTVIILNQTVHPCCLMSYESNDSYLSRTHILDQVLVTFIGGLWCCRWWSSTKLSYNVGIPVHTWCMIWIEDYRC